MSRANKMLATLRQELEFLDSGGYRGEIGSRQPLFCMESSDEWRQPLFFEDSPSCPKERYEMCSTDRDCALMDFVPVKDQRQKIPCRHVLLNGRGETIASMARAGARHEQIETALRNWLVTKIEELRKR